MRHHLSLLAAAALICSPVSASAEDLSLAQAVKLALKNNTELQLELTRVEEAEAVRLSTRGLYGFRLNLDANLLVWDSPLPFEINLPDASQMDLNTALGQLNLTAQESATLLKYSDLLGVFPKLMPLFFNFDLGNIRDQVTAQVQVTLAQPLTPLLQIHNGYKATSDLALAVRADQKGKVLEVAHKVSKTYLQLMQAWRFAEVAQTGVDQVEAHLKQAKHFYDVGLIGRQDVLKAQLELARAKERMIKARTGVSLASSALALLMGLGMDHELTLTEKVADPPPAFTPTLSHCLEQAMRQRSEVKAMQHRMSAADRGRKRAMWDMVPQLSAVATYQYTHGQGTFSPEHSFFAGGVLKWEIWDWGNKYYAMKAAGMKARQAELGQRMLRDGIQLQTKQAYLELTQSEEALTVARVAITEAEENFRIEKRRFEANANTSTDVLDAQLALTRSNLAYASALYSYYIARDALLQAMGQLGV